MSKFINIFIYLLSFTSTAIGIFLNFFLARVLEADSFGKIQYYVALATTLSQFAVFGLNTFLIRETKNEIHNQRVIDKCLTLYFCILTFLIPIFYFILSNFIPDVSGNIYLCVSIIIASCLMGLNTLFASYFQGGGRFHLTIIFENLLPKLSILLFAIVFVLIQRMDWFENNYLLIYICIYSAVLIPFLLLNFKKISLSFKSADILSIIFFFGVTITYSLGNNLTKVLQGGIYRNDVALGIISVSLSIISLVRVFTSVLSSLVKPLFAKYKRDNDINSLFNLYQFDTRMNSYIAIPLYLFFCLHAKNFLMIFGESYTQYPYILTLLSIANLISDVTGPNGTMLSMTGKEKWELLNGFIYFGVYIIFVFVFSFDKVYGLCVVLILAQFVVNVVKFIEVWFLYKKSPLNLKTIITLSIVFLIDFLIIYLYSFLRLDLWLWVFLGIIIGIIIVILNCFVLSLYRKTDFKTMLKLRV